MKIILEDKDLESLKEMALFYIKTTSCPFSGKSLEFAWLKACLVLLSKKGIDVDLVSLDSGTKTAAGAIEEWT